MKGWFTMEDKEFMTKNHEATLHVPELPEDVNMFISTVEDVSGFPLLPFSRFIPLLHVYISLLYRWFAGAK
jgi:hypothetical protein